MKLLGHKLDKVNDRYIHIDMTKLQKSREKVNLSYKKMKKNL